MDLCRLVVFGSLPSQTNRTEASAHRRSSAGSPRSPQFNGKQFTLFTATNPGSGKSMQVVQTYRLGCAEPR
jgi:hypothetical protein